MPKPSKGHLAIGALFSALVLGVVVNQLFIKEQSLRGQTAGDTQCIDNRLFRTERTEPYPDYKEMDQRVGVATMGPSGSPVFISREGRRTFYNKCSDRSCTTVATQELDQDFNPSSIAFNDRGHPMMISYQGEFVHCNDQMCASRTIEELFEPNTAFLIYTKVFWGKNDKPAIVWAGGGLFSSNDVLYYVTCNNDSCSDRHRTEIADVSPSKSRVDVEVGSDGNPVFAFVKRNTTSLILMRCTPTNADQRTCSRGGQQYEHFVDTVNADNDPAHKVPSIFDLVIGNDGIPMLAYQTLEPQAVHIAHCRDISCSGLSDDVTVQSTELRQREDKHSLGTDLSFSVNRSGLPILVYPDETDDRTIKVASCLGLRCSEGFVVRSLETNLGGTPNSSAPISGGDIITHGDYPIVAYDGNLVYCKGDECDGSIAVCGAQQSSAQTSTVSTSQPSSVAQTSAAQSTVQSLQPSSTVTSTAGTGGGGGNGTEECAEQTAFRRWFATQPLTHLTLDPNGFPASFDGLNIVRCTDANCTSSTSTPVPLDFSGIIPSNSKVHFLANGNPALSFGNLSLFNVSDNLVWSECSDVNCSSMESFQLAPLDAGNPVHDAFIDSTGNPIFIFQSAGQTGVSFMRCNHSSKSCTVNKSLERHFTNSTLRGNLAALVGPDDIPIVAYQEVGPSARVVFGRCADASCSSIAKTVELKNAGPAPTQIFDIDIGWNLGMEFDEFGRPVIMFGDSSNTNSADTYYEITCSNLSCDSFTEKVLPFECPNASSAATSVTQTSQQQTSITQTSNATSAGTTGGGGGSLPSLASSAPSSLSVVCPAECPATEIGVCQAHGGDVQQPILADVSKGVKPSFLASLFEAFGDFTAQVGGSTMCIDDRQFYETRSEPVPTYNSFDDRFMIVSTTRAGIPVMVKREAGGNTYIQCTDAQCSSTTSTVMTGYSDIVLDIAHDHQNKPLLLGGDLRITHCDNPSCSSFTQTTGVDTSSFLAGDAALYLNSRGLPGIAFSKISLVTNSDQILWASCDDMTCSNPEFQALGNVHVQFTRLRTAQDAAGNPYFLYRDRNGDGFKYMRCRDPDQKCNGAKDGNNILQGIDIEFDFDIAIAADGNPVIAYRQLSPTQAVKIVHCSDPTCSSFDDTATIEEAPNALLPVGFNIDLSIGNNGAPQLTYINKENQGGLRFATCNTPRCSQGFSLKYLDSHLSLDRTRDRYPYTKILESPAVYPMVSYVEPLVVGESAGKPVIAYCSGTECDGAIGRCGQTASSISNVNSVANSSTSSTQILQFRRYCCESNSCQTRIFLTGDTVPSTCYVSNGTCTSLCGRASSAPASTTSTPPPSSAVSTTSIAPPSSVPASTTSVRPTSSVRPGSSAVSIDNSSQSSLALGAPPIIDNGDAGYHIEGPWTFWADGYENALHYHDPAFGEVSKAYWAFEVEPGEYKVSVTWVGHANRSHQVPVTIFDGTTAIDAIALNQELDPDDFFENNVFWENLGTYVISGNELRVMMTNDVVGNRSDDHVVADAVRVELVGQLSSQSSAAQSSNTSECLDTSTCRYAPSQIENETEQCEILDRVIDGEGCVQDCGVMKCFDCQDGVCENDEDRVCSDGDCGAQSSMATSETQSSVSSACSQLNCPQRMIQLDGTDPICGTYDTEFDEHGCQTSCGVFECFDCQDGVCDENEEKLCADGDCAQGSSSSTSVSSSSSSVPGETVCCCGGQCGNGVVDAQFNETCEPNNDDLDPLQNCRSLHPQACTYCGDGNINEHAGEQCDPGTICRYRDECVKRDASGSCIATRIAEWGPTCGDFGDCTRCVDDGSGTKYCTGTNFVCANTAECAFLQAECTIDERTGCSSDCRSLTGSSDASVASQGSTGSQDGGVSVASVDSTASQEAQSTSQGASFTLSEASTTSIDTGDTGGNGTTGGDSGDTGAGNTGGNNGGATSVRIGGSALSLALSLQSSSSSSDASAEASIAAACPEGTQCTTESECQNLGTGNFQGVCGESNVCCVMGVHCNEGELCLDVTDCVERKGRLINNCGAPDSNNACCSFDTSNGCPEGAQCLRVTTCHGAGGTGVGPCGEGYVCCTGATKDGQSPLLPSVQEEEELLPSAPDDSSQQESSETFVAAAVTCGDGVIAGTEECDDGNVRDNDGCSSICLLEQGICGDGVVQVFLGEQCESSIHDSSLPYGCSHCRHISFFCGDGNVDLGEECDEGTNNSAAPDAACRPDCGLARCGDGILDSSEQCDDGNRLKGDGCDSFCVTEVEEDSQIAAVVESSRASTGLVGGQYNYFDQLPVNSPPMGVAPLPQYNQPAQPFAYPAQQFGFPQNPTAQPLPMQLPLAQLQPLIQARGPMGDTGPGAIIVTGTGVAAGWSWMRRKKSK